MDSHHCAIFWIGMSINIIHSSSASSRSASWNHTPHVGSEHNSTTRSLTLGSCSMASILWSVLLIHFLKFILLAESWKPWEEKMDQGSILLKPCLLHPWPTIPTLSMALLHYSSTILCRETNLIKTSSVLVFGLILSELFWIECDILHHDHLIVLPEDLPAPPPKKSHSISNSAWHFWNIW